MKCPNCGAEIDNDSVFCYSCGKKVEAEKIAPQEKVEKPPQGRFSRLSIASLVTGILTLILSGILLAYSIVYLFIGIMLGFTSFYLTLICALVVGAIVCGTIDLNKIKVGKSTKKSRGFNITGIVLGVISILQLVTSRVFWLY